MGIQTDLSEAIKALIDTQINAKFNIAFGFFQSYAPTTQDTSSLRYCNLKLHYKTVNSQDINLLEVPILYPGSKNSVDDWSLVVGDELIVLFSDRSLEQWNPLIATESQTLNNPVRDSINHGFCIPINSHHNDFMKVLPPDATVGRRVLVKSPKKVQVGNGVDEAMKNLYNFINIIGSLSFSDGDTLATALSAQLTNINAIGTSQLNITKI